MGGWVNEWMGRMWGKTVRPSTHPHIHTSTHLPIYPSTHLPIYTSPHPRRAARFQLHEIRMELPTTSSELSDIEIAATSGMT